MKTTSRITERSRRITFYTSEMVVEVEFNGWLDPYIEVGAIIKGVSRIKEKHLNMVKSFIRGNRKRIEKFLLQPGGGMDCAVALGKLNTYLA